MVNFHFPRGAPHDPSTENWYSNVLYPITISDLRFCLKGCKNNKSGGPSGLTYEMIKALPDDVLIQHFLSS